jgi:hypothetical protein
MGKIKPILGYLAAGTAVPLVIAAFIGMEGWMQMIAGTGLRISPWITGNEVAFSIPHRGYRTQIHRPVFMGLLWETADGFVQVDWTPKDSVPTVIDETIDYDRDGWDDFRIRWNTQTGGIALAPLSQTVQYLEGKYELQDSWSIRVRVRNPVK